MNANPERSSNNAEKVRKNSKNKQEQKAVNWSGTEYSEQ